ncbi:MAG: ATP-binding cassette domain-containing protein [candidate division WOR-3 bacterium]|nr:ATP-binding cassette domain-containing protein [candidate division WOR-3 bacterium]
MIRIHEVHKNFGNHIVLNGISFEVTDNEIVVILGPSGTGKTVLLKIIAGLIKPDSGSIFFDGKALDQMVPDEIYELRKQIGFVFQGSALFDSLTVYENIGIAIEEHTNWKRGKKQERIKQILEIIGLPNKHRLRPKDLSGGMMKLVGIGRALALDPPYLFYDEPTVGLDPIMKSRITELIITFRDRYQKSGIVVTHDLESAQLIGSKLYMLKSGKIQKISTIAKEKYE